MSQGRRRSPLPPDWPRIRAQVLNRDDHQCRLRYRGCTGRATQVDHVGRDDDHRIEMLQAACTKCHATKTGRDANTARQQKYDQRRPVANHPGLLSQDPGG